MSITFWKYQITLINSNHVSILLFNDIVSECGDNHHTLYVKPYSKTLLQGKMFLCQYAPLLHSCFYCQLVYGNEIYDLR